MGGKRNRTGQYLYLFLACMMLFGAACERLRAPFPEPPVEPPPPPATTERWDHLLPVQARIESKDFDGAVQVYQDMLAGPADRNPDLALYDLGLLYAHYANPKKDYKKALLCFSRVTKEYPASPFAEEAKIWISVLESMEKAQRVDIELEQKKKEKTR